MKDIIIIKSVKKRLSIIFFFFHFLYQHYALVSKINNWYNLLLFSGKYTPNISFIKKKVIQFGNTSSTNASMFTTPIYLSSVHFHFNVTFQLTHSLLWKKFFCQLICKWTIKLQWWKFPLSIGNWINLDLIKSFLCIVLFFWFFML